MKFISATVGGIDRVYYVPDTENTLLKAQAARPASRVTATQEPTTPPMISSDLERALREALIRQLQKRSPLGELIGQSPELIDVLPDTREVVYRFEEKFWKAGFVVNGDGSVTLGTGSPVAKTWTLLSSLQRRELERAVMAQCAPWKAAGDADPKIVAIQEKTVVADFCGELLAFDFEFQHGRPIIGSYKTVERRGEGFASSSNVAEGSEALNALAVSVQRAMSEHGRNIDFGTCLVAAEKAMKTAPANHPREFPAILSMLFNKEVK